MNVSTTGRTRQSDELRRKWTRGRLGANLMIVRDWYSFLRGRDSGRGIYGCSARGYHIVRRMRL